MSVLFTGAQRKQSSNVLDSSIQTFPVSMGGWVFVTVDEADKRFCICAQTDATANRYLRLGIDATEQVDFRVRGDLGIAQALHTTSALSLNTWHHIAGVWVDATNLETWFDGVKKADTVSDPGTLSPDEIEIGNFDAGTSAFNWGGRFAEGFIYNRRLVQADFDKLFTDKHAPDLVRDADLKHYLPFILHTNTDEKTALTWADVNQGSTAAHPPGIIYTLTTPNQHDLVGVVEAA